jgi:nicotinamide phosphoribosyltransferase
MFNLIKPFNIILACDTYKFDHHFEYPADTKQLYSVIVPRKPSKYSTHIVAMGQTFVAALLSKVRIEEWMIDEAEIEINQQGYEFNRTGWEIIAREMEGKLPIAVYAVEEGRVVKPQTPILGIINTDDRFAWLVSYLETWVQEMVWKMSTVSSHCRAARGLFVKYMTLTGAVMEALNYKYHNFGDRGADSPHEAPIMAGIAHAALFDGSDCARANGYIKSLYRTSKSYTSSVVATEHSVMCSHSDAIKRDDFGAAKMAVERLYHVVKRTKGGIGIPLMSVVIDTYDSRRFVKEYMGGVFKDAIIKSGGKMVMRPDSGKLTEEPVQVARDLDATFGSTLNAAGYKVLHPSVGIIQGDGIRIETLEGLLQSFVDAGFSIDNLVTGSGAGITHEGGRDDFSFSMKAVARYDGVNWIRLLKEPKTDLGKKSLTGLVRCYEDDTGELQVKDYLDDCLYPTASFLQSSPGWRLWFQDGHQVYTQSFDSVREFARKGL